MFRIRAAVLFSSTILANGAMADDAPAIVVVGHGVASHAADVATLTFTVHGEGKMSVEALGSLATQRDAIESALAHLAGAAVTVRTSTIGIVGAPGPSCTDQDRDSTSSYLQSGPCAVIGYIAEVGASADVVPAEKAGNAASLAAEKGASEVKLGGVEVSDERALVDAAAKAAIDDARRQAATIAAASGVVLGPVQRIQDNDAETDVGNQQLVVTAQKREASISPAVQLDYRPPPVTRTATFTVVYSVGK